MRKYTALVLLILAVLLCSTSVADARKHSKRASSHTYARKAAAASASKPHHPSASNTHALVLFDADSDADNTSNSTDKSVPVPYPSDGNFTLGNLSADFFSQYYNITSMADLNALLQAGIAANTPSTDLVSTDDAASSSSSCAGDSGPISDADRRTLNNGKYALIPVVFVVTLGASILPWFLGRLERAVVLMGFGACLSGGVILGAGFSHILVDARNAWTNYFCIAGPGGLLEPDHVNYPFAELISVFTLLLLVTLDSALIRSGLEAAPDDAEDCGDDDGHGHSHGGQHGHSHAVPVLPKGYSDKKKEKKKESNAVAQGNTSPVVLKLKESKPSEIAMTQLASTTSSSTPPIDSPKATDKQPENTPALTQTTSLDNDASEAPNPSRRNPFYVIVHQDTCVEGACDPQCETQEIVQEEDEEGVEEEEQSAKQQPRVFQKEVEEQPPKTQEVVVECHHHCPAPMPMPMHSALMNAAEFNIPDLENCEVQKVKQTLVVEDDDDDLPSLEAVVHIHEHRHSHDHGRIHAHDGHAHAHAHGGDSKAVVTDEDEDHIEKHRGSKRAVSQAYVFFFALALHSIFDGLSIGSEGSVSGFYSLLFAVGGHKILDGFALGVPVYFARLPIKHTVFALVFCALMTPMGIIIGQQATDQINGEKGILSRAFILSLSAGSFFFISIVELLPAGLMDGKYLLSKMFVCFIGWGAMVLIALWV